MRCTQVLSLPHSWSIASLSNQSCWLPYTTHSILGASADRQQHGGRKHVLNHMSCVYSHQSRKSAGFFALSYQRICTIAKSTLAHADMSALQAGVHLAFLSARPESVRGLTEAESFKNIFNPLLKRGELYCSPVLLLGSIHSGPTALLRFMLGNR